MLIFDDYAQLKNHASENKNGLYRAKVEYDNYLIDNGEVYYIVSEQDDLHPIHGYQIVSKINRETIESVSSDPRVSELDLYEVADKLRDCDFYFDLEIIVEALLDQLPPIEDEEEAGED